MAASSFPKIFDYARLDVNTENWVSENPGIYFSFSENNLSLSSHLFLYLVCSTAVIRVVLMQEKNTGGCVENTVSSFKLISFREHFKNFGGQQRLRAATCQSLMSMRHCCSLSAIPWFVKLRRGIPECHLWSSEKRCKRYKILALYCSSLTVKVFLTDCCVNHLRYSFKASHTWHSLQSRCTGFASWMVHLNSYILCNVY